MSSRNAYLSPEEREDALCLRRALDRAREQARAGEVDVARIQQAMRDIIGGVEGAELDYAEVVDETTFQPLSVAHAGCRVVLAVRVGGTRLIDNAQLRDF
jgi:pantoate--beta-alanine ligase